MKRRVLFVINSLAGGGAERVMATLLANSRDRLDQFDLALAILDQDARAFALPDWLKVFQLDCRGGMLASISATGRTVRDYDADVTLSFLTRANLATGLVARRLGLPCIISERTSTPAHLGSQMRQLATKAMMRAVYPRASKVIAVSAGVATKISRGFGVRADKIEVIANPVDSAALEAAAREGSALAVDQPYVIAVGRLVSVKNYALLIRAFAKAELPCRLVIAGDGPERDVLARLADSLGIADRVIMPGWLTNPYPAVGNASLFALTSNVEGFPNALVEALALGVPAVATNCMDGPAEILARSTVDDITGLTVGEAGILSPVGDVDSFARGLQLAFEQPARERLAVAGRARAQDYSAPTIADRYWKVIERVLERASARAA